ncbi:hypothetical protein ACJX0J_032921 [Zea mays]
MARFRRAQDTHNSAMAMNTNKHEGLANLLLLFSSGVAAAHNMLQQGNELFDVILIQLLMAKMLDVSISLLKITLCFFIAAAGMYKSGTSMGKIQKLSCFPFEKHHVFIKTIENGFFPWMMVSLLVAWVNFTSIIVPIVENDPYFSNATSAMVV